jgi:uncharacterized membrane protein YeaQ/YmgE (transglycosylase-associated protein family)
MILQWLLVGLVAGSVAKMITPQDEKGGWLSSLGIGVVGSIAGGFVAGLFGISTHNIIGSLIVAIIGSLIVLYIYHKYLSDKF